MISIAFQLTPAQCRLLLATAFDDRDGDLWIPSHPNTRDFVTPMNSLIRRGLVKHDPRGVPSYVATDLGRALASAIADECRAVVAMANGAEKRREVLREQWALARRLGKPGQVAR